MQSPKIGVTVPHQGSSAFNDYLRCIAESGAEVVPIAPNRPCVDAEALIAGLDGLLLPGGGDVEPARYGAVAHPETGGIRPALDGLEIELVQLGRQHGLPLLAICRGHQLLNVALGGALHQHIEGDTHRAQATEGHPSRWHDVHIEAGSRLAILLGAGTVTVNSRHHQAVLPETVAPSLRAVAYSPDGFVEGLEARDGSWTVGVQWHPEREEIVVRCRPLFEGFIRAAAECMTSAARSC